MIDLRNNKTFIDAIKNHSFIINPDNFIEEILKDPQYYSSLLMFLNNVNIKIPKKAKLVLGHNSKMPNLNYKWLEILLTNFLYNDKDYDINEQLINELKSKLKKIGCIERKKVNLKSNSKINKMLINSLGKINSIIEIVKSEQSNLKKDLRMVILTDFIRKDVLPNSLDELKPINSIGVIPICESLRRVGIKSKIGVLSGSMIIISKSSIDLLNKIIVDEHFDTKAIRVKELIHDNNYYEVEFNGKINKQKVNLISKLFACGDINILVGTKSLLGEGWDEPTINSLILASFVESYMLSNQMRGRAIRVNKQNNKKTANIWHLVCVDKYELYEEKISNAIVA